MNAFTIAPTVPDATAKEDAKLVSLLHLIAEDAARHGESFVAARVADAAVALDEYRAGLRIATPAPSTGFALLRPAADAPATPAPAAAAPAPVRLHPLDYRTRGRIERDHQAGLRAPESPIETGTLVRFMAPQGGIGPSVWAVKHGTVAAVCTDERGKTTYAILSGSELFDVAPTQILLVSTEGGAA